ncbi:zf-TFIIB domain-containing protein [Hyalangium sp.]|uniref:TFIIB-type zinc ribbon-containing protein n=1 Tax=Hyalangium sp. TaxID=2028555 RepID=UPI002D24380D|nr:zf-TFIIB domain-containing protein [Hyalangium sp.]HYH94332.1 zf-TFIIB domain-containing protein [Hyalangium sp.]
MRCPTCVVPLDSLRVGEIELDECPRCQGLWFDRGELHAVLTSRMALQAQPRSSSTSLPRQKREPELFTEPSSTDPAQRLGPCSRCSGLLMPQKSQERELAACARCGGFWVPQATFNALRAQQPTPRPTPKPAQKAPGVRGAQGAQGVQAMQGVQKARPAPAVALRGRCPACDTPMRPEDRQGQGYHRCTQCGGIFLPRGGLTFILAHAQGPFEAGPDVKEGVREHAGCPVCRLVLRPISWQGKPVRVWACTQCWGTFAPATTLNQLQNPEGVQQPGFQGVGGGLWRMLDSVVEWLVSPPKPPQF